VLEIQHYTPEPISLGQTIGDDGDSHLGDFIEDTHAVVAVDAVTLLQDHLQAVLATLSERETSIIQLQYGLTDGAPRTLMRSATSMGSPENASDSSKPR
jgi:RNA polymerase primary sigma factor